MSEFSEKINTAADFETPFLRDLRISARERGVPTMLPETAAALSLIAELKKPKRILEIGTAVGYSGSVLLSHADKECKLTTIEVDANNAACAKENFKLQKIDNKVTLFIGDAEEIIPVMSGNFDFIFLDGPKSRYLEFYPYLKKMLNVNGVLAADNVLFRDYISGEKKNPHRMQTIVNNMREFLEVLTSDSDFLTQVLDVGDGISLSVKVK